MCCCGLHGVRMWGRCWYAWGSDGGACFQLMAMLLVLESMRAEEEKLCGSCDIYARQSVGPGRVLQTGVVREVVV